MATVNDKVLDAITGHSVDLTRLEASLQADVLKELKVLEKDLIKKLKNANLEANSIPLKRKRMQALLAQTKKTIKEAYVKIDAKEATNMASVAGIAETQAVAAINGSIKAKVLSVGMSDQMLGSIASNTLIQGAPSREWWSGQATSLQSGFKNIIRQSMLAGETTSNIVNLVRGTEALRFKDGLMQTARNKAEALVRTSVQVVANEARIGTYESNRDVVKYIEWVSTLDSRTSSTCQVLDGKKWAVGTFKPIGPNSQNFPGPTAHWNCRSTQVPVLKSWKELGSKRKFDEIPASTRSSMDGQVSSKISYEDWLKSKGQEFQKEVLGPGKFELWKAGKIGFKDLTNSAGNPLTVSQLQLKYDDKPKPKKPAKIKILNEKGTTASNAGIPEYIELISKVQGASGRVSLENELLTRSMIQATSRYTGGTYKDINDHLRHGQSLREFDLGGIKSMDDMFAVLPRTQRPMKLFRSRQSDKMHKIGDVLTDKGFGSTSTNATNDTFGLYDYEITIPTGSNVGFIASSSQFKGELEVLLNRGYRMTVTKITKNGRGSLGKTYHTTLELE